MITCIFGALQMSLPSDLLRSHKSGDGGEVVPGQHTCHTFHTLRIAVTSLAVRRNTLACYVTDKGWEDVGCGRRGG